MSDIEQINQSLALLAERDIDLTPRVYDLFFARCPDAAALFASAEARTVQGKMLNELVQTVLDRLEGKAYSDTLVATMVSDHNGWGVTLPMYDALFAAWVDALAESQGCQTSDPGVAVWQRQLAALREHVRFAVTATDQGAT